MIFRLLKTGCSGRRLGPPRPIYRSVESLGVHTVKTRPDLFHAYIGVAQLVNDRQNQIASYEARAAPGS